MTARMHLLPGAGGTTALTRPRPAEQPDMTAQMPAHHAGGGTTARTHRPLGVRAMTAQMRPRHAGRPVGRGALMPARPGGPQRARAQTHPHRAGRAMAARTRRRPVGVRARAGGTPALPAARGM
eukprot:CAMPEP_0202883676 /NCGR_PEP_ID=MMETSP1391-20130828/39797_1 /ASSEMBLY_ACC=CAM_ASM_000867 /TAXON_ID=1034604 /ORGANISM="Chlamydomonas leiostraca, Strain SAG 11-49" /LENGTH=123 /DNA_ID=CAMNT_0049566733 /DNA_START=9 /DNA_END=377 /DNA_ORIENTATION=-